MSFTVLLVDDHPIVRHAYRQQIEGCFEDARVICSGSLADAFRHLDELDEADLAIVDLNLPDASGTATIGAFRSRAPIVRVAALSGAIEADIIHACRAAGASGFIPKTYTLEQFATVLRQLESGAMAFPDCSGRYPEPVGDPHDAIRLPAGLPALPVPGPRGLSASHRLPRPPGDPCPPTYSDGRHLGLTERQRAVLRLMLQGLSNKAICRRLDLAEGTVKVHVSAVLRALGVATRAQVVVAALRVGICFDEDLRPGG